jgi:hypothetical protein
MFHLYKWNICGFTDSDYPLGIFKLVLIRLCIALAWNYFYQSILSVKLAFLQPKLESKENYDKNRERKKRGKNKRKEERKKIKNKK